MARQDEFSRRREEEAEYYYGLAEDGEMTYEEADTAIAAWESGYGDYLYDCRRDMELEDQICPSS